MYLLLNLLLSWSAVADEPAPEATAGANEPAVKASAESDAAAEDSAEWFSREIRPALSNACFHCHGPDESTRQADLRLDTAEGIASVVDAQDPQASELWRRLTSTDPSDQMPPPDSNKSLSQSQQQALLGWVEAGAPWQQHWSFVRPTLPPVPDVQGAEWCRSDIDRFVLARMENAGLTPAEIAPPTTLIRRLFLDLVGMPPTPLQTEYWLDVAFPNGQLNWQGYQRLVDSLIADPGYGERWGRRWLDLARYADTNGYEKDRPRSVWPYRDWVVEALNRDLPFDQFTIQQIAGDMLPEPTKDALIATGFHRNTMLNEEGGIDPLEFRFHAMTDRVATTGTAWLGLTLGCCQCHTHKYDPISHTEYFQFMALLNNADEPEIELPSRDQLEAWQLNQTKAEALLSNLRMEWPVPAEDAFKEFDTARRAALPEPAFEKWLVEEQQRAVAWTPLQPVEATASLPILTIEPDQSIFASGDTAKRDDYHIVYAATDRPIYALQLEALPDDRLPARGPGSTYYEGTPGDFYLTELEVSAGDQRVAIKSASESYGKNRFGSSPAMAAQAIDGDIQTGWAVDGRQGERHVAVFVLEKPIQPGEQVRVQMSFGRHFASSLGRFRMRAAHAPSEHFVARDDSEAIETLLVKSKQGLSSEERNVLLEHFLLQAPEVAEQAKRIRELLRRPAFATTLVMRERPEGHPRPTHRHHRGEYLQPAELVQPGVPDVLNPLPDDASASRLALARWLVAPENPLTARVAVNRQWAAFFGTGLVKTVEDFGLQGDPPSHPELLDYLAVTWVERDHWSLKALHRRMVTSATYMQSSMYRADSATVDPGNRLLSFFPRVRLDAEQLRDSVLVASGTLSRRVGGPPVRPPQPVGITEVAFGSPGWTPNEGADRFRRSLYTFQKRTAPFAMFSTFDAPSGEACIARRTNSNSPLQALTLLNDVMLMELANATGSRVADHQARNELDVADTVRYLFQLAMVREPSESELKAVGEFYQRQRETLPAAEGEQVGDVQQRSSDAWGATARVIFALDEFQTRE